MLRMYLIILFVVGVGASLLGRLPQQSSSAARESVTVPFPAAASNSPATGGQSVNEMDRSIELTRDANGYFYADVQINGAPVHMVVDTGATVIALSRNDAQMAGLATSNEMNDVIVQGAVGVVPEQVEHGVGRGAGLGHPTGPAARFCQTGEGVDEGGVVAGVGEVSGPTTLPRPQPAAVRVGVEPGQVRFPVEENLARGHAVDRSTTTAWSRTSISPFGGWIEPGTPDAVSMTTSQPAA